MEQSRSLMLEEITEQPAALERTIRSCAGICQDLKSYFSRDKPSGVLLAARGTSDNAAQFGRYLIEVTTRLPAALAAPSVYTAYGVFPELRNVLVIGLSQSGESTDVNSFVSMARSVGAATIAITNEPGSTLTQVAEHSLLLESGKERSVAATKTYTGQVMALYLIAEALGGAIDVGKLHSIPGAVDQTLQLDTAIEELAQRKRDMHRAVSIGRGLNYGNALECSLKLMETCQVIAQPFSAADFLHGPIAMLGPLFPAMVFAPPGATEESIAVTVERLLALSADVVLIGDEKWRRYEGAQVLVVPGPPQDSAVPDLYTPIPYIVPAQLFAAHLAAAKELNADRPPGLTKVTQTL